MTERVRFQGGPLDGETRELDVEDDEIVVDEDSPRDALVYRRLATGRSTFVLVGVRPKAA